MIEVHVIPALTDNYIYLLHDKKSQETVAIDPSLGEPVTTFLKNKNWTLKEIWNTHHHWDHTGGNLELKKKFSCKIYGPKDSLSPIPGLDKGLNERDFLEIGQNKVKLIETPGHTSKALCFYLEKENLLFCGDSLFALGCGRLFEGTAEQLWQSLEKIKRLRKNTFIYGAHEYTEKNCLFALSVDPLNKNLKNYQKEIKEKRRNQESTYPTVLAKELETNPFLRTDKTEIKKNTGTIKQKPWETFKALRELKDKF